MDVNTAAQAYMRYIQPFAGKAELGAPDVTNGGGTMGLTYLSNFISNCSSCTIDFVETDRGLLRTTFNSPRAVPSRRNVAGGIFVKEQWVT